MREWFNEKFVEWAGKLSAEKLEALRGEAEAQLGIMFFVFSILFSIVVLLSPKIIPYLKNRFHIPNNVLCKLLHVLFAISLLTISILSCIFDIPYTALSAIFILAIMSFIPAKKLETSIVNNDSGTIKASINQIRSFFTFILIIFLTYSFVLNIINIAKLQ